MKSELPIYTDFPTAMQAITFFNYTPPQMTINVVHVGGYREYVPGGGHLKACPIG